MAEPRTLPHSAEAENAVIGACLLRGKQALAEALALVTEEEFYQPRAQSVFRAMRIVDERGEPIDVITVEAQLRRSAELELVGGIEGLARFDRFATAHNVSAHAQIVKDKAARRNLVIAAREVAEHGMLEDGEHETGELAASLFQAASGATLSTSRTGPVDAKPILVEVFQTITDRQRSRGAVTGCPTGYRLLDEMTSGLQPGTLIILAARPSMGKSALALNIVENCAITSARHAAMVTAKAGGGREGLTRRREVLAELNASGDIPHRWPALLFSLEMGRAELVERLLCSMARVDSMLVKRGSRITEGEFRSLIAAGERVSEWADIKIDDTASLSITDIRARASRWWARSCPPVDPAKPNGPRRGIVLVDYMQLAAGEAKAASRELEISSIARGLKKLAKELRIPVVALSQLNRQVDARADHRPQLSDLRESGTIEQDADVVAFVYREERYHNESTPEDVRRAAEGKAELIIGKQRGGPIGTVPLAFLGKYTRFEELEERR